MIFFYFLFFGIIFALADWGLGKFIGGEDPIYNFIEDFVLSLAKDNIWLYLLLLVAALLGSAWLAISLPENSLGYWLATIATAILAGFFGKAWLKS